MAMVVRSNIMAVNANRQLGMNNSKVGKSLEKLASGFKINRAGDDASGLAISEKMKAQIKGLDTASSNSQDGISLIQTAEGALTEVHDMLNRMVELAGKAANGTMDTTVDRSALQKEFNSLIDEIDRIAASTNFNGIKLLDGSLGGAAAGVTLTPPTGLGITATTAGGPAATAVYDLDLAGMAAKGAGDIEIGLGGKTYTITAADGDDAEKLRDKLMTAINDDKPTDVGTAGAFTATANGTTGITLTATANGAITLTGMDKFTATAKTPPAVAAGGAAAAGPGKPATVKDVTWAGAIKTAQQNPAIPSEFTTGAFTTTTPAAGTAVFTIDYTGADGATKQKDISVILDGTEADGDAITAKITAAMNADTDLTALFTAAGATAAGGITFTSKTPGAAVGVTGLSLKTAGGGVTAVTAGAVDVPGADASEGFDLSGVLTAGDKLTINDKTYTFDTTATADDADKFTSLADLKVKLEKDGVIMNDTANTAVSFTLKANAPAGNGLVLQIGDSAETFDQVTVSVGDMSSTGLALNALKVDPKLVQTGGILDETSARAALVALRGDLNAGATTNTRGAINVVSDARADLGALQNRLEHTVNNLDVASENMNSANSRIRDTDMAKEMMEYTKMNVLTQAAQAMLAQANQQPQSVLQLLQ